MNDNEEPEEVEQIPIGKSLVFFFNKGCQYVARKRCNENPNIYGMKIEFITNESGTGTCFCLTGEMEEMLLACTHQHEEVNKSDLPRMRTFLDCCRSSHEMVLESTSSRKCPVHLFVDLEIKKAMFGEYGIPDDADQILTKMVVDIILIQLKRWSLAYTDEMAKNIICMSSTRPDKWSVHVLFKNTTFASIGAVQEFAIFLEDAVKNIDPFKMYPNRIIDFGVFHLHSTLRCLYMCKAFTKSLWDTFKRAPKKDYQVYPVRMIYPPLYPTTYNFPTAIYSNVDLTYSVMINPRSFFRSSGLDIVRQIITCSIGMDRDALQVVNCVPKLPLRTSRPSVTYNGSKKRNFSVAMDEEGKKKLDEMYENIPCMSNWPIEYLIDSCKMKVDENLPKLDITQPSYVFKFWNVDTDVGLPCFRDATFFQPNSADPANAQLPKRMHSSEITLNLYLPFGDVYQTCWPHQFGHSPFLVGNCFASKRIKLNESFAEEIPPPKPVAKFEEDES